MRWDWCVEETRNLYSLNKDGVSKAYTTRETALVRMGSRNDRERLVSTKLSCRGISSGDEGKLPLIVPRDV